MIKKVILFLLLFLAIAIAMLFIDNKEKKEEINKSLTPTLKEPSEVESLVSLIFESAKIGQVMDVPFIVGKTDVQEVHELWGSPEEKSEVSTTIYEDYLSKNVTVGHRSNTVFDIRSSAPAIQQIHLEDIERIKGEADEIRSYQDDMVDQTILIYEVSNTYQLKWILPKATESEPNPAVDHISVFMDIEEETPTISDMSLEEKIGQMIFAGIDGIALTKESKELISVNKVGGLIFYQNNLKDEKQTVSLLNAIKTESKKEKHPLFLGVDQEGGRISRLPGLNKLPTNQEIGKRNNPSLSYSIGTLLGKEMNTFGFNLDFAPVLDVNSNPKNPVIGDRSFGNNAEIVSKLGIQTMKGIQSQNVISVVKHFPGHGDTAVDSHLELPIIQKSIEDLNALELIPFKNAIEDGADVVMVAHILLPKIDPKFPSSMSHAIITGILREQLQFDGVVMTDDMTMNAIVGHYEIGQAAVDAVKAGNDIVLVAHDYQKVKRAIDAIKQAVHNGEVSEERINTSVSRILLLKEKYKLNNERVQELDIKGLNHSIEQIIGK
ncbi:beta-N-acetylhexosaminidase [Psychrobacillus sp. NPDC058041]|uniref:beta-N-acetylhexosaminidase n=1 Tax=Psychrobacillus sp. NPDC058041 TaxID=3346310 RepID=UPI0036D92F1F